MNTSTVGLGIGMLALGVGVGWLIKPESVDNEVVVEKTAEEQKANSSRGGSFSRDADPSDGLSVKIKNGSRGVDGRFSEDEAMELEMKKKWEEQMAERQEKQKEAAIAKVDARVQELTEKLGLAPDESERLKTQLLADLEERGKMLEKLMSGEVTDPSDVNFDRLSELVQPSQVNKRLADLLTGESKEKFEALAKKQRDQVVESEALGELAKLQGSLDLTEAQKDAVYSKLYEERATKYDEPSAKAGAMAMMKEQMGGMGGLFGGEMMELTSEMMMNPSSFKGDNEAAPGGMKEVIGKRIDESVSRFDGILNEAQTEAYRKQLESKYAPFMETMSYGAGAIIVE